MAVELTGCRGALHCRISDWPPLPWSVHTQEGLLDPTVPVHAESAAKSTELTAKCSGMWDIHYRSNYRTQAKIAVHPMWAAWLDGSIWRCQSRTLRKTIHSSRVLGLKVIFTLKNWSISGIYLSTFSCTSWSQYIIASQTKCKSTHAPKGYTLPTVPVKIIKTDPKDSAKQYENISKLPSSRKTLKLSLYKEGKSNIKY